MPVNPRDLPPAKPQPSQHAGEASSQPAPQPGPPPAPASEPLKKKKPNKIVVFIAGFLISLAVGWVIEHVTDRDFLRDAEDAQADWIAAVSETSPIAFVGTYFGELEASITGKPYNPNSYQFDETSGSGAGIAAPFIALVMTVVRFFTAGGIATLVQLGLGALAVALFNFRRTQGRGIFFDEVPTSLFFGPVLIIAAASVIGLVLQGVMLGALYALSWITGLAAAAAGATGVVGFCWYCITKLGEKGVEHVATPHI